jgi:hypothetical protein
MAEGAEAWTVVAQTGVFVAFIPHTILRAGEEFISFA